MSSSASTSTGTPSKHKTQSALRSSTTSNSTHSGPQPSQQTHPSQQQQQWGKATRFLLLGFGFGAATVALFQSINLPTIHIQLEYDDAPIAVHRFDVQQRQHKQAFLNRHHQGNKKKELEAPHKKQPLDPLEHETHHQREAQEEGEEDTTIKSDEQPRQQQGEVDTDTSNNNPPEEEEEEDPAADNTNTHQIADVDETGDFLWEDKQGKKHHAHKKGQLTLIEQEMEHEDDDPDFSNPGPPPKLDAGEAFAACILIKDDNHWLIEWLAYHYHTMPLRYLIVAVDPDSKTSPIPILKRYKDKKLMTISVWDDKMFMPSKIKTNAAIFNNNTELMLHRVRQNNFYFKCMRTFKQRNREWLMLIDTDEYIVTNYASGLYYNITKQIPITKPGNVLTFIKQHHQLTGENHTCSYMPRYMFGIKESDNKQMIQRHIPTDSGIDGMNLLTQRFLYRNPRRMHNGKNLINIRKLPQIKTYTSVHHVSSYCPDPDKMRLVNHVKKALVRIHHYLGTPEQYFFRSDPRMAQQLSSNATNTTTSADGTTMTDLGPTKKTKNGTSTVGYFTRGKGRYQMLNKRAIYPDQGARAWIRGFIQDVGIDMAKYLLEGVGQVDYDPSSQNNDVEASNTAHSKKAGQKKENRQEGKKQSEDPPKPNKEDDNEQGLNVEEGKQKQPDDEKGETQESADGQPADKEGGNPSEEESRRR